MTFLLTLVGIPASSNFIERRKLQASRCMRMSNSTRQKLGLLQWGGLVFLIAAVVVSFFVALFSKQLTNNVGMVLFILVLYGLVGFLDDFLKVFRKINEGLNPKQKLALQLLGGVIFYLFYERGGDMLSVFGYQVHLGIFYIISLFSG